MYCSKCGKQLEDTVRFCRYCGAQTPVNNAESQTEKPASYAQLSGKSQSSFTKIVIIAIAVFVAVCVFLFYANSNKLNGTYTSMEFYQTFTFHGSNVTMSAFGVNASGTYEIKGQQITITYSMFGEEYTWEQSFSRSGNSIYIGGTEFVKQ